MSNALWRRSYEERDGKMIGVESADLFVWAAVNNTTGEVEMGGIQPYDDDLDEDLVEGWEWKRFWLIPDNSAEEN
jgi:hypothetical protein